MTNKAINTNLDNSNSITNLNDPTLGESLRAAYGNSSSIPQSITQQFNNPYTLPASLVTPRCESEIIGSSSIPGEFITKLPNSNTENTDIPQTTEFTVNDSNLQNNSTNDNEDNFTNFSDSLLEASEVNKNNSETNLPIQITSKPGQYQNQAITHFNIPSSVSNQNNSPIQTNYDTSIVSNQQNSEVERSNSSNLSIMPAQSVGDQNYSDITDYLNMPQHKAAKELGIPPSTLSKRWREAAPNRKWPYRTVCKIEKEITTLLHNIPQDGTIPKEIEIKLAELIAKRKEELKGIVIRLN